MEGLPDWLQELMQLPEDEARRTVGALAAEKTPESAQRLRLVEEAGPPALRKEARRALYRLRAAGVEIPPPKPALAATGPTRALISWVDRDGYKMVVCLVDRPSGGARFTRVLLGDEGIVQAELTEMSPGQLKRVMRDLAGPELRMVECPVPYAQRAVAEAASRGMPDDPGERGVAEAVVRTVGRPAEEVPHPAYGVLDPLAIKWDPDLLPSTPRLLETEEIGSWVLPPDRVARWVERHEEMASSPLIVDPATARARYRQLLGEAVRELFPPESLSSWRRRLEDMAYYFYRRKEERNARLALAAALALGAGQDKAADGPGPGEAASAEIDSHPFLLALVEKSLQAASRHRETGEERGRIIVPRR
ncbi:MAG: hypothetical protein AB1446_08080 [Bacillota bacterium]